MKTRKLTISAMLTALALALGYFERFIPLNLLVPLPGIKLGLANIVTMFALYELGWGYAAAILFARCLLGSLFGGSVSSLAFSLTGGFLSLGIMMLMKRVKALSVYGVSVSGAAAHNTGQILAAAFLMRSFSAAGYLPFLLLTGCVTGMITGFITSGVLSRIPDVTGFGQGREG